MSKRRSYVFIALVLALLIIAGLTAVLTRNSIDDPEKPDPQDTPEVSQNIDPTQSPSPSSEAQPTETPAPTETPEATETPEPTATTIPSELPKREVSSSGSFSSDTGTNLNMTVSWTASAKDNENVELKFDIYLTSYTIGVGARIGTLTVNGTPYNYSTDGFDVNNNKTKTTTLVSSKTVTVPVAAGETVSIPVSVDWLFNGTYNGKPLDTVTASDTLLIKG